MQIVTPRLILRELRESDLDAVHAYLGDPVFQRYEGRTLIEEETREKLRMALRWEQEQPRTHYRLAITIPPEDVPIGHISLTLNNREIREWEIGWGVLPACWGKGYASEAAREVIRYAIKELNAHRVVAFCHAYNTASARVMEKIGMQQEGHLRETRWLDDAWHNELVYAILERDFQDG